VISLDLHRLSKRSVQSYETHQNFLGHRQVLPDVFLNSLKAIFEFRLSLRNLRGEPFLYGLFKLVRLEER
jgi:hypothetical protein